MLHHLAKLPESELGEDFLRERERTVATLAWNRMADWLGLDKEEETTSQEI